MSRIRESSAAIRGSCELNDMTFNGIPVGTTVQLLSDMGGAKVKIEPGDGPIEVSVP